MACVELASRFSQSSTFLADLLVNAGEFKQVFVCKTDVMDALAHGAPPRSRTYSRRLTESRSLSELTVGLKLHRSVHVVSVVQR